MPSLNENREYNDICWIDTRNACSLSKRFRTIFFQFFTTFKSNSCTFVIIKPFWNLNRLISLCPFSRLLFLFDIWRIMTHNINFIYYARRKSLSC